MSKESLIEKISGRLNCPANSKGFKGCIEDAREIIAMVRQLTAQSSPVIQREISVTRPCENTVNYWKTRFLLLEAKYANASTKPVSVSLERCILAARKAYSIETESGKGNFEIIAKAVLDAAGVKYHED